MSFSYPSNFTHNQKGVIIQPDKEYLIIFTIEAQIPILTTSANGHNDVVVKHLMTRALTDKIAQEIVTARVPTGISNGSIAIRVDYSEGSKTVYIPFEASNTIPEIILFPATYPSTSPGGIITPVATPVATPVLEAPIKIVATVPSVPVVASAPQASSNIVLAPSPSVLEAPIKIVESIPAVTKPIVAPVSSQATSNIVLAPPAVTAQQPTNIVLNTAQAPIKSTNDSLFVHPITALLNALKSQTGGK
jgi:hypothetical protein